jgi:hypothetical protein
LSGLSRSFPAYRSFNDWVYIGIGHDLKMDRSSIQKQIAMEKAESSHAPRLHLPTDKKGNTPLIDHARAIGFSASAPRSTQTISPIRAPESSPLAQIPLPEINFLRGFFRATLEGGSLQIIQTLTWQEATELPASDIVAICSGHTVLGSHWTPLHTSVAVLCWSAKCGFLYVSPVISLPIAKPLPDMYVLLVDRLPILSEQDLLPCPERVSQGIGDLARLDGVVERDRDDCNDSTRGQT